MTFKFTDLFCSRRKKQVIETEWAVLGRFYVAEKRTATDLTKCKLHKLKELKKQKTALWKSELSMLDLKTKATTFYIKFIPTCQFTSMAFFFRWLISGLFEKIKSTRPGWWFHTFFLMFIPIWGNDPIWLIFRWGLQPPTSRVSKKGHDLNHLACFFFAFKWHFRIRCVCPGKSWVGGDEFPAVPQLSNEKENWVV